MEYITDNDELFFEARTNVLNEYMAMRKKLTHSQKCSELLEVGLELGWTNKTHIGVNTLKAYSSKKGKVPEWIGRASIVLLQNTNWIPGSNLSLQMYIYLKARYGRFFKSFDMFYNSIPEEFKDSDIRDLAKHMFENVKNDHLQTIFWLEDAKGKKLGNKHIAESVLRKKESSNVHLLESHRAAIKTETITKLEAISEDVGLEKDECEAVKKKLLGLKVG
ncbi:hypothetical protein A3715_18095 [Oleiphilus sp. HI0009]|nr:hypothetical protein A3715_18095 [Oleiphilus sp. HI0009]